MAAATVDELSAGPFILSMGSSRKVQVEPEHGAPYGKPLTCVRESIEIIRKLTQASHDGRLLKAAGDQGGGAPAHAQANPRNGQVACASCLRIPSASSEVSALSGVGERISSPSSSRATSNHPRLIVAPRFGVRSPDAEFG